MPYNFSFYIHHHGAGHIMRAIAIAENITDSIITFLGSNLAAYRDFIPDHINCVHLPIDLPQKSDQDVVRSTPNFLHYAPLNVLGQLERNFLLATFFRENPNTILVVDVSVEITLLARLFGVPSVVIRQHGDRNDKAHELAYESAELIIAPYPDTMADRQQEGKYAYKTIFSGGFSRYTGKYRSKLSTVDPLNIAIFTGKGGTCLDHEFVAFVSNQLPEHHFHVSGADCGLDLPYTAENITYHGILPDPLDILESCAVVICNAGHNTVMEMADLNKAIVCIPEDRPFSEQVIKAKYLHRNKLAVVVMPADLYNVNWAHKINETLLDLKPDRWKDVINQGATALIASRLKKLSNDLMLAL